ncbi:MAG: hypothetical protein JKY93_07620 [Gammaproteobacteria bacterium]|nr:hypothetical protein [Gammaproteobacteria bacterium]
MNTELEQKLSNTVLGETRGDIVLEDREAFQLATLWLFRKTQHVLRIFSYDLESDLLDRPEVFEAVSKTARDGRNSSVHILVQNSTFASNHGHALVRLAQKIPSHVQIRATHKDYRHFSHSYTLADETTVMFRKNPESYIGTINFNDPFHARELHEKFDEIWDMSEPDASTRQLSI